MGSDAFEPAQVRGVPSHHYSEPDDMSAYQMRDRLASHLARVLDLEPVIGVLHEARELLNGPIGYSDPWQVKLILSPCI